MSCATACFWCVFTLIRCGVGVWIVFGMNNHVKMNSLSTAIPCQGKHEVHDNVWCKLLDIQGGGWNVFQTTHSVAHILAKERSFGAMQGSVVGSVVIMFRCWLPCVRGLQRVVYFYI